MEQLLLSILILNLIIVLSFHLVKRKRKTEKPTNRELNEQNELLDKIYELDESVIQHIEQILKECTISHLNTPLNKTELTKLWKDAYLQGQKEGFHPIILEVDNVLLDSINAGTGMEWEDIEKFTQWRQEVLKQTPADGKPYLKKRLDNIYQYYTDTDDYKEESRNKSNRQKIWQTEIVGTEEQAEIYHELQINKGRLLMVKIPVDTPWKVFAYLPVGGWNACPMPEAHMSVAKYWQEKYGAVPAFISSSIIQYWVHQPPTHDLMNIAEEQLAYCEDTVFQGVGNLATLVSTIAKANVWYFWWD